MTFLGALGKMFAPVAKIGGKILSTAGRIGGKIAGGVSDVLDTAESIVGKETLGMIPFYNVGRKGLNILSGASKLAETTGGVLGAKSGGQALERAGKAVKQGGQLRTALGK